MKVGRGVPMTVLETRKLTEGTGEGSFDDPKVLYNTDIEHVSRELIQQCETIVKAEARRLGMTCVIIRGDLHNTTRTIDVWTKKVIMVEDPRDPSKQMPLLEPLDDHLTVSFGTVLDDPSTFGTDNIQLQGHVFVNVERHSDSTSWTGRRHESGLILSQPLWEMSDEFVKGLAKITASGGSPKAPDIFWALSPNDVPPSVKAAVESAVRQQTLESLLTCAIIRLETLGGYYSTDTSRTDQPIGHFAIYLGTNPANTDLKTHLSTDQGSPPKSQPKPPPTSGAGKDKVPRHHVSGTDADEQLDGARTPSMGEIEEEYGRVEERSKNSGRRLSRITASLDNWRRLK
ncbi:hypothetical protein INS49_014277 [Diaporthe citri]|uniref:uncharacterized protein n=1 Tax=Diaporthe citri TaxID=83186 RepID=UPI001C7E2D5E|nr:uncharacterized protein INS49_014277 [Diaporthe citri]KAG6358393.1 hypothetical protein INS49_014277 [Diaporthe citri]